MKEYKYDFEITFREQQKPVVVYGVEFTPDPDDPGIVFTWVGGLLIRVRLWTLSSPTTRTTPSSTTCCAR